MLVFGVIVLLFMFCRVSGHSCEGSVTGNHGPSVHGPNARFHLSKLRGVVFLIVVINTMVLDNMLPKVSTFRSTTNGMENVRLFKRMALAFPTLVRVMVVLLTTFLSFGAASGRVHVEGRFA